MALIEDSNIWFDFTRKIPGTSFEGGAGYFVVFREIGD
jgi:hypothetical protein